MAQPPPPEQTGSPPQLPLAGDASSLRRTHESINTRDRAFEILRCRSQLTNTKPLPLAQQLLEDFAAIERLEDLPTRTVFDELLLTAHNRTTHALAS